MHQKFIRIAAILMLLAVILGAFGAHALKAQLESERLAIFEVGIRYHFYHALGLLAIGILYQYRPSIWLVRAGYCMLIGLACFSGSLYLLACRFLFGIESWSFLGPITPIGGLFFILAWGMVAGAFWDDNNTKRTR